MFGQRVGVKQIVKHVWLVSLMQQDLGYCGDEKSQIESAENPFAAKLSICPVGTGCERVAVVTIGQIDA
jgi:hypothetical protein